MKFTLKHLRNTEKQGLMLGVPYIAFIFFWKHFLKNDHENSVFYRIMVFSTSSLSNFLKGFNIIGIQKASFRANIFYICGLVSRETHSLPILRLPLFYAP